MLYPNDIMSWKRLLDLKNSIFSIPRNCKKYFEVNVKTINIILSTTKLYTKVSGE
jgi:hypothetical protein